jgi:hypothetical protein
MQSSNNNKKSENIISKNNAGIQTPANDSYQQSLYIAAISQFIGCEGLASPASDVRDGIEYTFNFYHPECGKVFKVFKSDDLSEYEKYTQYPEKVAIIVDVSNAEYKIGECGCCGDMFVILPHDLGDKLHDTDSTWIYCHGHLCEFVRDAADGASHWLVLDPIALQDSEDGE